MKKILIIVAIALFVPTACNNNSKNKDEQKSETKQKETLNSKVESINYADFINDIWDFQASPNELKYKGSVPCVIDFYATWCGPCKQVAPILDNLSIEYSGIVKFYKIDVDQEKKLGAIFGIESIPTVIMIPTVGDPIRKVGALGVEDYKLLINRYLNIK